MIIQDSGNIHNNHHDTEGPNYKVNQAGVGNIG